MNLFPWLKSAGTMKPSPHILNSNAPLVRKRYCFSGFVQGVGFRWEAKKLAEQLNLTGWIRNECDGSVTMEIEGKVDSIVECIRTMQGVPRFDITDIQAEDLPCSRAETNFRVVY